MATLLFNSPIFGPIQSRRLGRSLGINCLPADGKLCSFDCIYCECGFNEERRPASKMPTREALLSALETKLQQMAAEKALPDSLTFAGNGEPTMHPEFPAIIAGTLALRAKYCPQARVSVLTNATRILRDDIFETLLKVDTPLLKLDSVNLSYIKHVDRPTSHYPLEALLERMAAFKGHAWIQTLFMQGHYEDQSVDNTTEDYVGPWLEALSRIQPAGVAIYTLDRDTPAKGLKKADKATLDGIARRVEALGLHAQVSY